MTARESITITHATRSADGGFRSAAAVWRVTTVVSGHVRVGRAPRTGEIDFSRAERKIWFSHHRVRHAPGTTTHSLRVIPACVFARRKSVAASKPRPAICGAVVFYETVFRIHWRSRIPTSDESVRLSLVGTPSFSKWPLFSKSYLCQNIDYRNESSSVPRFYARDFLSRPEKTMFVRSTTVTTRERSVNGTLRFISGKKWKIYIRFVHVK